MGVVNSFITKTVVSDTEGDEIDFEMIGAKPWEVRISSTYVCWMNTMEPGTHNLRILGANQFLHQR